MMPLAVTGQTDLDWSRSRLSLLVITTMVARPYMQAINCEWSRSDLFYACKASCLAIVANLKL